MNRVWTPVASALAGPVACGQIDGAPASVACGRTALDAFDDIAPAAHDVKEKP